MVIANTVDCSFAVNYCRRLVLVAMLLGGMQHVTAQQRMIATSGASEVVLESSTAFPQLSVVGQSVVGRSAMGPATAHIGIDYIRMFAQTSTTVYVELPDTTVRVGASIRIPIVVRSSNVGPELPRIRRLEVRFVYMCEVIDLFGVDEREQQNGECVATFKLDSIQGSIDTVWIEGVSKLCSRTSTPLLGTYSQGIADRGRVEVVVRNGELRQDGHCVTDGSTRLVFSTVGVSASPYPASSFVDVALTGLAQHKGTLRLLDLNGNEVMQRFVSSDLNGRATDRVNVSQLASGSYTIQYLHDRGVSSATIMVYR